jgi:hypothetical protein
MAMKMYDALHSSSEPMDRREFMKTVSEASLGLDDDGHAYLVRSQVGAGRFSFTERVTDGINST